MLKQKTICLDPHSLPRSGNPNCSLGSFPRYPRSLFCSTTPHTLPGVLPSRVCPNVTEYIVSNQGTTLNYYHEPHQGLKRWATGSPVQVLHQSTQKGAQGMLCCRSRKVRCDVSIRGRPCMNCYRDNETCIVTARASDS